MAERSGKRELTYSAWHRPPSLKRFMSIVDAARCGMVDIDDCEYEADNGNTPRALIETAHDVGQTFKPAFVTGNLATLAGLPSYVVLFTPGDSVNPGARFGEPDITQFRVAHWDRQSDWTTLSPQEYADFLLSLRTSKPLL